MRIYIDTSAYAKYYGSPAFEKGTAQIEKLILEVAKAAIFCSVLTGLYQKSPGFRLTINADLCRKILLIRLVGKQQVNL